MKKIKLSNVASEDVKDMLKSEFNIDIPAYIKIGNNVIIYENTSILYLNGGIGNNVIIGANCHIEIGHYGIGDNTIIGDNCRISLFHGCDVNTIVGDNCHINVISIKDCGYIRKGSKFFGEKILTGRKPTLHNVKTETIKN